MGPASSSSLSLSSECLLASSSHGSSSRTSDLLFPSWHTLLLSICETASCPQASAYTLSQTSLCTFRLSFLKPCVCVCVCVRERERTAV